MFVIKFFQILCLSLMCIASTSVRANQQFSRYPRLPSTNYKKGGEMQKQQFSDYSPDVEHTTNPFSLDSISIALKPFYSYFTVGAFLVTVFKLAQNQGLFAQQGLIGKYFPARDTESLVAGLRDDQEQIWKAILNIQSIQNENRVEIERLRADLSTSSNEHIQRVEAIASQLDGVQGSLFGMTQKMELSEADTKNLREALAAVEDGLHRHSTATAASVQQLREDLPQMMQRRDTMVTEKLNKFKDDLKQILVSRNKDVKDTMTNSKINVKTNAKRQGDGK